MAKTKRNKALARTIVGLGTLCAGAVIWASISGQMQPASNAIQQTALISPGVQGNAGAPSDTSINTPMVTPLAPVTTLTTATPAAAVTATLVPTTANTPAQSAAPQTATAAPPPAPAATVNPAPAQAVVQPAPRLKTRGS